MKKEASVMQGALSYINYFFRHNHGAVIKKLAFFKKILQGFLKKYFFHKSRGGGCHLHLKDTSFAFSDFFARTFFNKGVGCHLR